MVGFLGWEAIPLPPLAGRWPRQDLGASLARFSRWRVSPTARGIGFEPALEAAGLGLEGSPEVSDEFTNGAAGLFEVALDVLTSALLPSAPDLLYGGHAH